MPLPLARARAEKLLEAIAPHVTRAAIVGSIRREKPEVGDIEILAVPRMGPGDLFTNKRADTDSIIHELRKIGSVERSGERYIKVQLGKQGRGIEWNKFKRSKIADDWPTLDLFLCHFPAQWGTLSAIRTGPAHFSQAVVTRIRQRGWRVHRGAVWMPTAKNAVVHFEGVEPGAVLPIETIEERQYIRIPTPEEEQFFDAAGLETVPPNKRGTPAALHPKEI